MVSDTILKKALVGKALTDRQKLSVLLEVRELVRTAHTRHAWYAAINGVEHYCLYGAAQKVLGVNRSGMSGDGMVNRCGLTSTMFDALPKHHVGRVRVEREYADMLAELAENQWVYDREGLQRERGSIERHVMEEKVEVLQGINDDEGREAVLKVLNNAIRKLRRRIAA